VNDIQAHTGMHTRTHTHTHTHIQEQALMYARARAGPPPQTHTWTQAQARAQTLTGAQGAPQGRVGLRLRCRRSTCPPLLLTCLV